MIRAFLKDSVIYAVPALLSRGISIFLIPLYTRVLSPADYGSFDLFMVFSGIISLVVALEISQGVARFYAGEENLDRRAGYASSALWFTVFCYFIFLILSLFFSEYLSLFVMGREELKLVFQVGVLYIALNAIFGLVQSQFRWELKSKQYALASILFSTSSALCAVILAYFKGLGLLGLVIGMAAGAGLGALYGLWKLRNSFKFKFDVGLLREMLIFSTPLVPSSLAVIASIYVDRVMISYFMTVDDVGIFGVGARLASLVGLLMVGFQGALSPLIYTHYRDSDTPGQLAIIFRYFIASALLLSAGISIFSKDILMLMTTSSYYGAASIVVFLAPSALLAQMYIFAPGIGIAKKNHLMIWINLGGLSLSIILNWFLIPLLGIDGAGLSTLLSYVFVFVVYMSCSQRYYPVPHSWRQIWLCSLLCCFFVVFALQFDGGIWERWSLNFLLLLTMFAVFVKLGLIRADELMSIKNMLKGYLRKTREGN